MAVAYFSPDYSDMTAAAIKFNGNITALAEHFKVSRETMHQYMKRDPKGKEIIDQVRCYNNETMLDCAEHVIRYNLMNYKNNAGLAQRASEKVIDRLGHLRGWSSDKNEDEIHATLSSIKEKLENGEITQHKTNSEQAVETK
jgi:hypothetical protein